MKRAYQFRLPDGGGMYITDAENKELAKIELQSHFLRPVLLCEPVDYEIFRSDDQEAQRVA